MIAKISRGRHTYGLLRYLVGPGRSDEHTNPQVIAGSGMVLEGWRRDEMFPEWSRLDLATLATHLDAHAFGHLALARVEASQQQLPWDRGEGEWADAEERDLDVVPLARWENVDTRPHVMQIVLSLGADEGLKGQGKWQAIAQDYLEGMGWSEGVRWAAFHHGVSRGGNDHVHLVVSSVREDGTWLDTRMERRRSTALCRELERRHGLRPLKDHAQERGLPGYSAAEARRAGRYVADAGAAAVQVAATTGRERAERATRMAATMAANEAEFVRTLRGMGIGVRPRFSEGGGRVVGYSVLIGEEESGKQIWCGGGRLARDLTLPKLRERWSQAGQEVAVGAWAGPVRSADRLALDRDADWSRKVQLSLRETRQDWTRRNPLDPGDWNQMTSDMAAMLTAAGRRLDGHNERLARAAREVSRAGQFPSGQRGYARSPHAGAVRAARLMLLASSRSDSVGWTAVLAQMAELLRTLQELQEVRGQRVGAERLAAAQLLYVDTVRRDLARVGHGALSAAEVEQAQRVRTVSGVATTPPTGPRPRPQAEARELPPAQVEVRGHGFPRDGRGDAGGITRA